MLATATLFLAMMVPLVWSPGPNNVMCATVGAKQGVKESVPFILGLNVPIFVYALLTGFGLAALLNSIPRLAPVLTLLGALYVVFLGVKLLRASSGGNADDVQYGFRSGLVISSLNVKVVAVLVAMYSQFANDDRYFSFVLAVSFVLVCVVGHLLWNAIGRVSSQVIKNEKFLRIQNRFYGALLAGVGIWMFLSAWNTSVAEP
ncbi:LysE family translocator [Modicisalibacter coralii]|uniref:LysE family translocator n=1 Tax=Modicisalibacter coralii TaxID=2304602 RepID=UPI00100B0213|nr:LysE family translocator [Halomonas coralii]